MTAPADHVVARKAARQRWLEGHPRGATIKEAADVLTGYSDEELQEYARGVSVESLRAALLAFVAS